jgi:hypothetical protein
MKKNWMITSWILLPAISLAQLTAEEEAKANNPLADVKALNFQNYYVPSLYDDADLKANTMLLRYAMPFAKGKILSRLTVPLATTPSGYNGSGKPTYTSGLGDINFFLTYTFSRPGAKLLFGAGPQLVMPTASNDILGAGKWQLGGALVLFTASKTLQLGSLITYQTSIAGDDDRSEVSLLIGQPFVIMQLGKGSYLRSTGLWNFNLENDSYNIPLGIGAGQVVKTGKTVLNIFLEPQFTLLHYGSGQPAIQIFGGINCQF